MSNYLNNSEISDKQNIISSPFLSKSDENDFFTTINDKKTQWERENVFFFKNIKL